MITRTNWGQKRRKTKYNSKKATYGGRTYDSKKEADYAQTLDWRKKLGEIRSWTPQVPLELRVNGVKIVTYICDFRVVMPDGSVEYHETKGFATADFKIKWKLFEVLKDEIDPGCKLVLIR